MTQPTTTPQPTATPQALSSEVPATSPEPSPLPQEIYWFAEGQRIADATHAVLAMTQRLYPSRQIRYRVECDPEGPQEVEDYYILFDVDVTGMTAEELAGSQWRWCQEIVQHCPAPLVSRFRLGWEVS
jgi:hypothetical protein